MGLSYRIKVYSRALDVHSTTMRYSLYETHADKHLPPPGFARDSMLEFIHTRGGEWFIENGIAVSVETYVDPVAYQYNADLIAYMTPEQKHEWEKHEFLRRLSN